MKTGRKPITEEKRRVNVTITLSKESLKKLNKLTEENKTSRGQEVEKLLGVKNV